MAKSIGSVYIDIEARTAKLEEGVAKADKALKSMRDKMEAASSRNAASLDALGLKFLKFNLYAQASANLIQALGQAISQVNNNAADLGRAGIISPGAVAAVEAQTQAWEGVKQSISSTYAELIKYSTTYLDFAASAMKGSGYKPESWGFAGQVGAEGRKALLGGVGSALSAYDAMSNAPRSSEMLAEAAAGGAAQYEQQRLQLVRQRDAAQREADLAAMGRLEQISALEQRAAVMRTQLALDAQRTGENGKLSTAGRLQLEQELSQIEQRSNAQRKAGVEMAAALASQVRMANLERENAGKADTERLAGLEQELAAQEAITNQIKAGTPLSKEQEIAQQRRADLIRKIAALEQQISQNVAARAESSRQGEFKKLEATLSGQAKYNALLAEEKRLRDAAAAENDTGRYNVKAGAADTAGAEAEAYRTQRLAQQQKALQDYQTARDSYAKKELSDLDKLKQVEAEISKLRGKVDPDNVTDLQLLNDSEIEALNQINAKLNERAALHAKAYASDKDAAQAANALEQARWSAYRRGLTDQEEYTQNLDKITALETRMAKARETGGAYTTQEIEMMREAGKLYERNGELIEANRQKMVAFTESMLSGMVRGALEGKKLTEILQNMAKALADYIIQEAMIKPLARMIVGQGMNFLGLGTSADGNPIQAGRTTLVGEQGPELVTFSSSARVDTTQKTMSMLGRQSDEPRMVYAPVYNVAAGVTEKDLAPILRAHAEQVRGSIAMDLAKGGGRAARFR